MRAFIFTALALASLLLVFFITRSFLADQAPKAAPFQAKVSAVQILVAKRLLPSGTILKKNDYEWRDWPQKSLLEDYIQKTAPSQVQPASSQPPKKMAQQASSPSQQQADTTGSPQAPSPSKSSHDYTGQVVRFSVPLGAPLSKSNLIAAGERGFLASALSPGMRAATVGVSATTGVSGFIFPGDRVDVILVHEPQNGPSRGLALAETVIQNIRVLAMDQRAANAEDKVKLAKTATLEVTPKMAEKLALMPMLGNLTLSLRSLGRPDSELGFSADDDAPESLPFDTHKTRSFASEVSNFLPSPQQKSQSKTTEIALIRGGKAQILRFQNRAGHFEPVLDYGPNASGPNASGPNASGPNASGSSESPASGQEP